MKRMKLSNSSSPDSSSIENIVKNKKIKVPRPFDLSKHPKRHVLLKIAYLGWDMYGLACQEESMELKTVESELFPALEKTRLIEKRQNSNYHRCGRTDKGVSAFSQVISIDLRCKLTKGTGVISNNDTEMEEDSKEDINYNDVEYLLNNELNYCKMLNGVLPKEIRVVGWSPVPVDFSARFDCLSRTYRYFFPLENLDLTKMREAGEKLLGTHDFKNFCKIDNSKNFQTTIRSIHSIEIKEAENSPNSAEKLVQLDIQGKSFLWHQIRCIVALLIYIGKGQEKVELISELLDLDKTPNKPQYGMALDYPLNLYKVEYDKNIVNWINDDKNTKSVIQNFQVIWAQMAIKAQMLSSMIGDLKNSCQNLDEDELNISDIFIMGNQGKAKEYKSILDRPVCKKN